MCNVLILRQETENRKHEHRNFMIHMNQLFLVTR